MYIFIYYNLASLLHSLMFRFYISLIRLTIAFYNYLLIHIKQVDYAAFKAA